MSNRNGDKSRHHRQRKEKIRRRAAFGALRTGNPAKEKSTKTSSKSTK